MCVHVCVYMRRSVFCGFFRGGPAGIDGDVRFTEGRKNRGDDGSQRKEEACAGIDFHCVSLEA